MGAGIDFSLQGAGDKGEDYKNPFAELTAKHDPRRNVLLLPSITMRNQLRRDPHLLRSRATPAQQRLARVEEKASADEARAKAERKAARKRARKAARRREQAAATARVVPVGTAPPVETETGVMA